MNEIQLDREPLPPCGGRQQFQLGAFAIEREHLASGRSAGVQRLTVSSQDFSVALLPTRGMGIESVTAEGFRFGWHSPVAGPVHPHWVPIFDPSGLGWLEGFDELLVRCGLNSNGAPVHDSSGRLLHPLHGRIANLPAENVVLSQQNGELLIVGEVWESRFLFERWRLRFEYRICASQRRIDLTDTIENRSGTTRDFQLLYHFNLGQPLLSPHARILAPLQELAPRDAASAVDVSNWDRIGPPSNGFGEYVHFGSPHADSRGKSLAVLADESASKAAAIRYLPGFLPCFSIWKRLASAQEGYVIGLEPATNFPNPHPFEISRGRSIQLEDGADWTCSIGLEFATTPPAVERLAEEVLAIQGGQGVVIKEQPRADWSGR